MPRGRPRKNPLLPLTPQQQEQSNRSQQFDLAVAAIADGVAARLQPQQPRTVKKPPVKLTAGTVPTLETVFRDYMQIRKLRPATQLSYRAIMRRCFRDWKQLRMNQITKDMVERKHKELTHGHGYTGGGQANLAMRLLRAVINFAVARYDLTIPNVVSYLSAIKQWNREKPRTDYLPKHLLKDWFRAVWASTNPHYVDYLQFLLLTGCRRSEGLELEWNDVCFESGIVTFRDTKNGDDHFLPVSDYALELLQRRHASRSVHSYSCRVFPISNLSCSYGKIVEQSGIRFTPHTLRRSFASYANELSVPLLTISRLLNHRSYSGMTPRYIQDSPEQLRPHVQAITDFILQHAEIEKSAAGIAPDPDKWSKCMPVVPKVVRDSKFSELEKRLLAYVAAGLSNTSIAPLVGLEVHIVQLRISKLTNQILGARRKDVYHSRTLLAIEAARAGLIDIHATTETNQ